jgi:Flp pilus assembly protein TadB
LTDADIERAILLGRAHKTDGLIETCKAKRDTGGFMTSGLIGAALAAGLVAWLATGWVAAVVVLPAASIVLPRLLSPAPSGTDVAQLAALAQWVRGLAGLLVAGAGIEHAVHASVASAPPAVQAPVAALSARLRAQVPTERALRAFADDLDDATGDLVASALILGTRRREGGLAAVLEDFAASVADEVRMRQAVEADRAKPRNTARWVTAISVTVITVLFLVTDYMDPYRDGTGQLVLVVLLAAFVASLAWMRRLSAGSPTPRFLVDREAG